MTRMQSFGRDAINVPIKILAEGKFCKPGDRRIDHVGVLLPLTGIIVHPYSLTDENGHWLRNHDARVAACRDLRVLGLQWELALREDWNAVIDTRFYNPAVDPNLYPGIKPEWHGTSSDCEWSKKDAAGRSASAWYVNADGGYVSGNPRYGSGFALAVARVGQ